MNIQDILMAINNVSKRLNETAQLLDEFFRCKSNTNAKNIETSAEGIDDLAEFADTNAGAVDDIAVVLDEALTAIDDLATYAASIDERLTALEKRGE